MPVADNDEGPNTSGVPRGDSPSQADIKILPGTQLHFIGYVEERQ